MVTVPGAQRTERLTPIRPTRDITIRDRRLAPLNPTVSRAVQGIATPFQGTRATSASFGGLEASALAQTARSISSAGNIIGQIAIEEQVKDNKRTYKNMDIALTQFISTTLDGDGTPENPGFLGMVGEIAVGSRDTMADKIEEFYKEQIGKAPNEAVRRMHEASAAVRRGQALSVINRHTREQRTVAETATRVARAAQAVNDAARAYWELSKGDELQGTGTVYTGLSIIETDIRWQAEHEGWGTEVIDAEIMKAQTVLVQAVVASALANDDVPAAAKALAVIGDKATGISVARMQGTIKSEGQATASQLLAQSAKQKHPDDPQAALAYIRRVGSGAVEDGAISRFKDEFREKGLGEKTESEVSAASQNLVTAAKSAHPDDIAAQRKYIRENGSGKTEDGAIRRLNTEQNEVRQVLGDIEGIASAARANANYLYSVDERARKAREEAAKRSVIEHVEEGNSVATLSTEQRAAVFAIPGFMKQMRSLEADVAEGDRFASSSDGETFATLLKRPDLHLMEKSERITFTKKLTEQENKELDRAIRGAVGKQQAKVEDNAMYTFSDKELKRLSPTELKRGLAKKRQSAIDEMNVLTNEIRAHINENRELGIITTREMVTQKAEELLTELTIGGSFLGLLDFDAGIVAEAKNIPEHLYGSIKISIERIPEALKLDVMEAIRESGQDERNEDLIEALAGAMAVDDFARARRLLGGLGPVRGDLGTIRLGDDARTAEDVVTRVRRGN